MIPTLNPLAGGPPDGIKSLVKGLRAHNCDSNVICLDCEHDEWLSQYNFPVKALGESSSKYGFSKKIVPWIVANIESFDAVIVHGIWQFHSLATYLACKKSTVPYFVFIHGALDPWFKHNYMAKHLKKYMYWLLVEYHVLRRARGLLFTSDDERLLARHSFWPYSFKELVVGFGKEDLYEKSALKDDSFLKKFPKLSDKKLILFVGRMHQKKGVDILVEGFLSIVSQFPDYHLVMMGPDPDGFQSKLEVKYPKSLSSHVTWTGWVDSEEKWSAYARAEVFVLVSHSENWGAAVVEALLSGTPVLLSDKVNIWREVIADKAGLVDKNSLEGVSRLLLNWILMPDKNKFQYAKNSRECFERNFDHKVAAGNLLEKIQ